MESPGTLACSSFYARTIFSFAIPEVLIEEDKVRDEFHQDNLLKTLLQFQPMRPQFPGFQIGRPIYNFNWPRPLIIFDHAYEEQFWGAFGPVQHSGESPLHFPYQMRYNG